MCELHARVRVIPFNEVGEVTRQFYVGANLDLLVHVITFPDGYTYECGGDQLIEVKEEPDGETSPAS